VIQAELDAISLKHQVVFTQIREDITNEVESYYQTIYQWQNISLTIWALPEGNQYKIKIFDHNHIRLNMWGDNLNNLIIASKAVIDAPYL
jgi:hypothetical protein